MNNIEDPLLRALRNERLSAAEKSAGKQQLLQYLQDHPAPADVRLMITTKDSWWSRWKVLSLATSSLLIILVAGIGVSYAAEGSLPGDLLYPVKKHLTETVRAQLATSPEAQSRWTAEVVKRRLDEAVNLAAEKRLNPELEAFISNEVSEKTEQLHQQLESLQDSGDIETASDISSNAQAVLDSRKQLFHNLRPSTLSTLTTTLSEKASSSAMTRVSLESHLATSTSQTLDSKKLDHKEAASRKSLEQAKALLRRAKIDDQQEQAIHKLLDRSEELQQQAQEALKENKVTQAYLQLQTAERLSDQALITTKDSSLLNQKKKAKSDHDVDEDKKKNRNDTSRD